MSRHYTVRTALPPPGQSRKPDLRYPLTLPAHTLPHLTSARLTLPRTASVHPALHRCQPNSRVLGPCLPSPPLRTRQFDLPKWPHTESHLPPISPHRRPPYQELWRLDLSTWEWDQLPQKGGSCPSARSGHRMALHKGRIIMFGGFFDNGKEVK